MLISISDVPVIFGAHEKKELLLTIKGTNLKLSRTDPERKKIDLNFYFHTSFWCLKRSEMHREGRIKPIWGN